VIRYTTYETPIGTDVVWGVGGMGFRGRGDGGLVGDSKWLSH
jgi:hypothetical protein